ncbi:Filamin-A, partial [Fragariocoptes setiger]
EGPGLKGGKLGEECKFKLKGTDGGLALSFHIEGPSKPMFETMAGKDCLEVSYVPLVPGDYKLCLMWYGKHIEGSPFHFTIEGVGPPPTLEELVQKIKISGKGLEFARSQEYNEIYIDCRRVYLKGKTAHTK